ncbi:hypothetical protein JXM83_05140 [Candidatus Woesearchaeota archaeon]|nr:hypothetical protein [Candidatus Woesearchaeota archaeon]
MLLRKTLASIVLALSLTGCQKDTGSVKVFDGRIETANVVFYNAKNFLESDRLEVMDKTIAWVYVDRDYDRLVDYAERREWGITTVFEPVSDNNNLLQNDILDIATRNYCAMLDKIEMKIKSELDLQYEPR